MRHKAAHHGIGGHPPSMTEALFSANTLVAGINYVDMTDNSPSQV
jgi:hypothetical protein